MFRLVVLFALVTVVVSAPGYLHVVPVATSHQERVDIIESHPIIKTVITPVHVISNDHEDNIHDIHDFDDSENFDNSQIYEDDEIHVADPIQTVIISEPILSAVEDVHPIVSPLVSSVQTVETHQELHQVHNSPIIHSLEPAVEDVHVESLPLPLLNEEEHQDVHSPVVLSLPVVDSLPDQQVLPLVEVGHDQPLVSFEHEEVPQVQVVHLVQTVEVPVVVGHIEEGDVHQDVIDEDGGHEW